MGTFALLDAPPVPPTEDTWEWPLPPHLRPGPALGAIAPHRRLLHWPIALLGIDWLGHPDHPPTQAFVVGRFLNEAWISRVRPDYDHGELLIRLAWDEGLIDPLGCTLLVRNELDGLPALSRHVRISDLPSNAPADDREPRERDWSQRTLDVRLPHGPRRSDWGIWLLSADGRLLDERPTVRRFESISMSFSFGNEEAPSHSITVGDRGGVPTEAERDAAVRLAIELEDEARTAAAQRRMSTSGEMQQYLRWRFSCRAGELLVCDPFLLGRDPEAALEFLERMDRPVRGLCGGISSTAFQLLNAAQWIEVRAVPGGRQALHDRVWIVGETGLLVGTSVTDLIAMSSRHRAAATTATELPFADTVGWREQFEDWWTKAGPARARRRAPSSKSSR